MSNGQGARDTSHAVEKPNCFMRTVKHCIRVGDFELYHRHLTFAAWIIENHPQVIALGSDTTRWSVSRPKLSFFWSEIQTFFKYKFLPKLESRVRSLAYCRSGLVTSRPDTSRSPVLRLSTKLQNIAG